MVAKKFKKVAKKPLFDKNGVPRWDLDALYPGLKSPELQRDKALTEQMVESFCQKYQGQVEKLNPQRLAAAIAEYEAIRAKTDLISCYGSLLAAENTKNIQKVEFLDKWFDGIMRKIDFFAEEVKKFDEVVILTKLRDPALGHYASWIASRRDEAEYEGSPLAKPYKEGYDTASNNALQRTYAGLNSALKIKYKGKLDHIYSQNDLVKRDSLATHEYQAYRAEMARTMQDVLPEMAIVYNAIMREKHIVNDHDFNGLNLKRRKEDKPKLSDKPKFGYPECDLAAPVIDTMYKTLPSYMPSIAHKLSDFIAHKRNREAICAGDITKHQASMKEDAPCTWDKAATLIQRAAHKLSPRFSGIVNKLYAENRIDAQKRPDKAQGGACQILFEGQLPFTYYQFRETMEDTVTVGGHEMGHSFHFVLAQKGVGDLLADTKGSIAEVASVFFQLLVSEEAFRDTKDPEVKLGILSNRVEQMVSYALSQFTYFDFENRVYQETKKGFVDAERISDIWVESLRNYHGPKFVIDDYERYRWMLTDHFFEQPFYVLSYSFSKIAACALLNQYQAAKAESPQATKDFVDKYIAFLEAGASKTDADLFEPFGLDPSKPEFWQEGLSYIDQQLDRLIEMDAALNKPTKTFTFKPAVAKL